MITMISLNFEPLNLKSCCNKGVVLKDLELGSE